MLLKKGIKLLEETIGAGPEVQRQKYYILSIRIILSKGDIVKLPDKCLSHSIDQNLRVKENGFFEHRVRIDRENLVSGIFYAAQGMKVGGYRKVAISPHLAYKEKGIPGIIPSNAKITVEIFVLREAENG